MSMPPSPLTITKVMSFEVGQLAAPHAFVVHLDQPGERRRAVLEQVVDIVDAVRGRRIAGRDDHGAAGLEQHHDVALEHVEELVQRREDAAAGAGAVARRNAVRHRRHFPQRLEFDLESVCRLVAMHLRHAERYVGGRDRRQPGARSRGRARRAWRRGRRRVRRRARILPPRSPVQRTARRRRRRNPCPRDRRSATGSAYRCQDRVWIAARTSRDRLPPPAP